MRYKALLPSKGFLGRYWRPGDISADTDKTPPVSKVNGELFEPLDADEQQAIDALEQQELPADLGPERKTLAELGEEMARQAQTGTGIQFDADREATLKGLKVEELKAMAEDKGIVVDPEWKKPQLLAELRKIQQ
jgi:hypothetical protein